MQTFTGWQYLLIDVANQWGLDGELFEDRIAWAEEHLPVLEAMAEERDWKEKPLYLKAVIATRKAQQGTATGHLVGFDAVCSGLQIMSTLTGCVSGARATGLIDPNVRADAYTSVTDAMNVMLDGQVVIPRKDAKQATMTAFYGSKETPKGIFGEDTPELETFHKSLMVVAPGATELLNALLESWQPYALSHDWVLPDNYHAHVKVMEKVEKRIEVDELDHATFTYEYFENEGTESGLSNVANVVHSIDAYLLRNLIRRCNYDPELIQWAQHWIEVNLLERSMGIAQPYATLEGEALTLQQRFEATQMADIRILAYVNEEDLQALSDTHLQGLARICESMLNHKPFSVVAVHDEFKCHANYMNHLRQHYIDIFAELADSTILDDVFSQLHGVQGTYPKQSQGLSGMIRQSNYGIC